MAGPEVCQDHSSHLILLVMLIGQLASLSLWFPAGTWPIMASPTFTCVIRYHCPILLELPCSHS